MATLLRRTGKLRRAAEPEAEILVELFNASASGFACESCGNIGLIASPAVDEASDWGGSRPCETCGKPIPAERVELFPNVKVCVNCQSRSESGQDAAEREFCPKCGALMKMRQSQAGGVTRYVMSCSECRK